MRFMAKKSEQMKADLTRTQTRSREIVREWVQRNSSSERKQLIKTVVLGMLSFYLWLLMSFLS